jgi:hypothetical protein
MSLRSSSAREQMMSAPRPWRTAQGKTVARSGQEPGTRPPMVGTGVRCLLGVSLVLLALGASLRMTEAAEQRISVAVAEDAVRRHIYRDQPAMNPSAQFPLQEITPPDVWDSMHVQVFEVTDGVREGCTYVVRDSLVYGLAPCWGGGLTSLALADLDHDRMPELYFTYVWGSGLSRTNVGAFLMNQAKWEIVSADSSFFFTDLVLRTDGPDTVAVYLASPTYKPGSSGLYSDTEWVPRRRVGRISLETAVGRPILQVKTPALHKWGARN